MTSQIQTRMAPPTTWPYTCELNTLRSVWQQHNRYTDTHVLTLCLCCVLPSDLCPWWVWSLLPWEQEALNPVWLPLAETSFKTIRLDVNQAHAHRLWRRRQNDRNTHNLVKAQYIQKEIKADLILLFRPLCLINMAYFLKLKTIMRILFS